MIEHQNVGFHYAGRTESTLEGINLHIHPGEAVLLTGGSGSGKSTLLRTANGLIPHATSGVRTGAVHVDGKPIEEMRLSRLCSIIGTVYQNPSDQLTHTWIDDELAFGLQNLGYPRDVIRDRIHESLYDVGLEEHANSPIHVLSGGQRQRLALACVMAMKPKALVLDEPTTQLDPVSTRNVLTVLEKLRRKNDLAILLVDHRTEEALRWTSRVIVLNRGRIVEEADWDDLASSPDRLHAHGVEVPELLRAANLLGCVRAPRSPEELALWIEKNRRKPSAGNAKIVPDISTTSSNPVLVELNDVHVRYSRKRPNALDGIDVALRQGELTAILGPNASGKSTLLRTLTGLNQPHAGSVNWHHEGSGSALVSLVPQDPDLTFIGDTVWDETAFAPRRARLPEREIRNRVRNALELTSLSDLAGEPPFALSQGQRQRVALAAALASQPRLLLLDEPTTGQDRLLVHTVLTRLKETFVRDGGSILMATHDLRTALRYAGNILVLVSGRLVYSGSPDGALLDPNLLSGAGHYPPPLIEVSRILGGPPIARPDEFARYWSG